MDLNALACEVADQWRTAAEEQSTELAVSTGAGPLLCRADATQLAVAIGAVVRNALEALGSGGRIELAAIQDAEPTDLPLAILIRDNGPGMSEGVRRRAFDPYFSGREAGRGLGFGLSKCWRIVREHGGEVLLDSEPGTGTQVTVRLPAVPPAAAEHPADSTETPTVAPAGT